MSEETHAMTEEERALYNKIEVLLTEILDEETLNNLQHIDKVLAGYTPDNRMRMLMLSIEFLEAHKYIQENNVRASVMSIGQAISQTVDAYIASNVKYLDKDIDKASKEFSAEQNAKMLVLELVGTTC